MKCIVTAGPTYEPLDEVRRLTNFSTGRLGTELANFLTAQGHDVTLLVGESATWNGQRRAGTVRVFSTTEDLRKKLKALGGTNIGAVFHAAAVSDFGFGKMFTQDAAGELKVMRRSKKLSTRQGNLLVELVPTPKIIAELRRWHPHAVLVGWKYEADGGKAGAVRAAKKQIADCSSDACVANGPAYGSGFGLVTTTGQRHFADREKLFAALAKMLVKG